MQLANVTASVRGADEGDLTAAAAAAVGIATTAVDAALLNVEQAVGRASQNKQVRFRVHASGRWWIPWSQNKQAVGRAIQNKLVRLRVDYIGY